MRARRTLDPVDARRLEELLRELGRVLRVVVLVEAVALGKVLGYERHHVLQQDLQVHGCGQRAVKYLQRRGAAPTNRAPQVQRGLLTRLRRILRLALELVERGEKGLERRLADEYVTVEVVGGVRLTPGDTRAAVALGEHGLASHATVDEAVLLAVVARLLGRRRLQLLSVQVLLYVAVGDLLVAAAHHVDAVDDLLDALAVAAVVVDELLDAHGQAAAQLLAVVLLLALLARAACRRGWQRSAARRCCRCRRRAVARHWRSVHSCRCGRARLCAI